MPVHATISGTYIPPDQLGSGTPGSTVYLRGDGVWATPAGGNGTSDHSLLTNLAADDHTQYFNTTRGDARYSQLGHLHTGTYQPLAVVLTNTTASFTTAQETKLAGIATGATANSSDATLLNRANHTGTQTASTISDFSEAVDDRVGSLLVAGSNVTLTYNDAANTLTIASTGGGGGGSLTFVDAALTSTQVFSTTTFANVTQLVAAMDANSTYLLDCFVTFQSAATTTGLGLGYTSPADCRVMAEIVVPITSTAAASQLRTIFPNAATAANTGTVLGTGVTAINSNHTARISGIIRTGATAGNFQVQARSEIAASNITLQIGSRLSLVKLI
jgi:hypothetical protein